MTTGQTTVWSICYFYLPQVQIPLKEVCWILYQKALRRKMLLSNQTAGVFKWCTYQQKNHTKSRRLSRFKKGPPRLPAWDAILSAHTGDLNQLLQNKDTSSVCLGRQGYWSPTINPSGACCSRSTYLSSCLGSKLPLSAAPRFVVQHKHSAEFTFNERRHNNSLSVCSSTRLGEVREGEKKGGSDDKSPARTMCSWQYYILRLYLSRQG